MRPLRIIPSLCTCVLVLACNDAHSMECDGYQSPERRGKVDSEIDEASGLVASRQTPGVLWTHNDSGDSPRLFAISTDGELVGTWQITGADHVDWEDIALGDCGDGADCLYIGDFGNNSQQRDDLAIYRVPEPSIDVSRAPIQGTLEAQSKQPFSYPYDTGSEDDNPDAEAMFIDPRDNKLYIATKELARSRVLVLERWLPGEPVELVEVGTAPIGLVTGADFRPDGARFTLRTYSHFYEFDTTDATSIGDQLGDIARSRKISKEIQGESIAYSFDSTDIYTLGEGSNIDLLRYMCKPIEPPSTNEDMGVIEQPSTMEPEPIEPDMGAEAVEPDMSAGAQDMATEAPIDSMDSSAPTEEQPRDGGCNHTGGAPESTPWLLLAGLGLFARRREEQA